MATIARKVLKVSYLRDGSQVGFRGGPRSGPAPESTPCRSASTTRFWIGRPLPGLRGAVLVETVLAEADVKLRAGEPQYSCGFGFIEAGVL